ncbi:MAG: hypothetical protein HUU46_25030 [Candidatus Hydrogenedentes bacterium]|nr:hypothetical protein [Candidatus Hydrogenedentota bacterium]
MATKLDYALEIGDNCRLVNWILQFSDANETDSVKITLKDIHYSKTALELLQLIKTRIAFAAQVDDTRLVKADPPYSKKFVDPNTATEVINKIRDYENSAHPGANLKMYELFAGDHLATDPDLVKVLNQLWLLGVYWPSNHGMPGAGNLIKQTIGNANFWDNTIIDNANNSLGSRSMKELFNLKLKNVPDDPGKKHLRFLATFGVTRNHPSVPNYLSPRLNNSAGPEALISRFDELPNDIKIIGSQGSNSKCCVGGVCSSPYMFKYCEPVSGSTDCNSLSDTCG